MTARCVMVLGTSSGAGKSWIATALCRHYANQGLKVAPFKAQNMSNNARVVAGADGAVSPSEAGDGGGGHPAAGPLPRRGAAPSGLRAAAPGSPARAWTARRGAGSDSSAACKASAPCAAGERGGHILGEIGSAQYFQALAARAVPDVRMNPLLLKPEADTRSQVVLLGQVDRELSALPWRGRSERVWPQIAAALDALRAENDVVVIEGAGSPAEINLTASDVVNLRVARHADARCLLVTDIDRGGAFAHLYGTWALMAEEDRARIRGFVLDKFRGDASLLAPAPEQLQALTGVPTVAVVPMRFGHGLPEEDGVFDERRAVPSPQPSPASGRGSEQPAARNASCASSQPSPQRDEGARLASAHPAAALLPLPLAGEGRGAGLSPSPSGGRPGWGPASSIRIAIVAYPRISNLDEFQPLKNVPGVHLTWARHPAALARADWIILPGSKATAADLAWLRAQGLDAAIAAHAARGGRVLGICGGLQMLGEALIDVHGVEPVFAAGPPQGENAAPLGGSATRAAVERGGGWIAAGPPQGENAAPLGGSATRAAVERGGDFCNGPGLGLLPLVTRFELDKTVRHATQRFGTLAGAWSALSSVTVSGYEIHSGRTVQHPAMAAKGDVAREVMAGLAWQNGAGNVLGVYLHGLFEDAAVLRALFGAGAPALDAVFDGLADEIERAFAPGVLQSLVQPGNGS